MAAAVFGRDEELRAIDAFLEPMRPGLDSLLLVGEPGIGKTILWQHTLERAAETCETVLSCRAVEAEAALAVGGVADLLADRLEEALELLAPPRRRALEVALLLEEPSGGDPDPRALGSAFLDVLRALAAPGPLLLAVDDLQWLDASSAGILAFAVRRLRDEPVRLLATARHEVADIAWQNQVSLQPLSVAAVHHLLRERLGLELTRSQLSRLHRTTRGNPFYSLEVGRELARRPTRLEPADPLPLPATLHELLADRLGRLASTTRDVLLGASALARPNVEVLVNAYGTAAKAALEEAVLASVLELDGSRVRFTHPLLATACYAAAPPWTRAAAHRMLVDAVRDGEERARHLALSAEGPDAEVASALDEAAGFAAARGATAAAAELWELAAERAPEVDAERRRQRRFRAADAHRLAGDRHRAETMLEALLPEAQAGTERADVLFTLASTRRASLPAMGEMCEQALGEIEDDDARVARIKGFLSWVRLSQGNALDALRIARSGLEHAERTRDPGLIARAIGRVSMVETWTVDITPGLLERGFELELQLRQLLEFHESPAVALERRLICQGEFEQARPILERVLADATERGDEGTRGHALAHFMILDWYSGRWRAALEHFETALELAEQIGDSQFLGHVLGVGADLELAFGRVERMQEAVEHSLSAADSVSDTLVQIWNRAIQGGFELARGDAPAASELLRDLPARTLELGFRDPADHIWPDAIEALALVGELERAERYLAQFEELGRLLDSRWVRANALRCRGIVRAAAGDFERAFEAFDQALAEHERLTAPFERARTLLALGVARRRTRQKRTAREALAESLALFEALGARRWAERAREEVGRIGGRRTEQRLTASELRVATLAAAGRSNKDIAAALFVTPHTVETHLSSAYRKLGVHSRAALGGVLSATEDPLAKV